jgi:hypothetical protein
MITKADSETRFMKFETSSVTVHINGTVQYRIYHPFRAISPKLEYDIATIKEDKLNRFVSYSLIHPGGFHGCTNEPTRFSHSPGTVAGNCSDT